MLGRKQCTRCSTVAFKWKPFLEGEEGGNVFVIDLEKNLICGEVALRNPLFMPQLYIPIKSNYKKGIAVERKGGVLPGWNIRQNTWLLMTRLEYFVLKYWAREKSKLANRVR